MIFSELTGTKVYHKTFGTGYVTNIFSGSIPTFIVEFEGGKCRRFNFPDAFTDKFLTTDSDVSACHEGKADLSTMSLRDRINMKDETIIGDMISGKYRINHDFGEAEFLIPPARILNDYIPTEDFWDLAVKFEYRLNKVMSRMNIENLPISEILRNDYLNIYLTGEPGCGKTTLVEMLCACFGLPFYVVNLSANIEEDEFTGTNRVYDGKVTFCETPFLKAYKYGGVVLLDEINAANPGVTIVLNDVLIKPFTIYENNVIPRTRNPLCIIAAASNPNTLGICPLNEATERRFNVAKAIRPADREEMIKILSQDYPLNMVRWACSVYEKCKRFLREREADEVYRALSIDSIRAVLNDMEEGRDSLKSLDNFIAKAATRDPELAEGLKLLCNSMVRFEVSAWASASA